MHKIMQSQESSVHVHIRMGRKCDLGDFESFRNCSIARQSTRFYTEKKKLPVSGSSAGRNASMMREVRLARADRKTTVTQVTTLYNRCEQWCSGDF